MIAAACDNPDALGPDTPATADRPEVGIVTDLPSPSRLVGEWAREETVELDGLVHRRTTIWRFDGSGTCRLTVAFYPAGGVEPALDESVCVYRVAGRTLTIRFPGVTGDERLSWRLEGGGVLVLDGVRYLRTGG